MRCSSRRVHVVSPAEFKVESWFRTNNRMRLHVLGREGSGSREVSNVHECRKVHYLVGKAGVEGADGEAAPAGCVRPHPPPILPISPHPLVLPALPAASACSPVTGLTKAGAGGG